jgi:hypothetical protein
VAMHRQTILVTIGLILTSSTIGADPT